MKPPREDKWKKTTEADPSRACVKHMLPLTWYEKISPLGGGWGGGGNRKDGSLQTNYGDELGFCPHGHLVKEFLSPEGEVWQVDEEEK